MIYKIMQNEEVSQPEQPCPQQPSQKIEENTEEPTEVPETEANQQEELSPIDEEESPERRSRKEPQLQKQAQNLTSALEEVVCLESSNVSLVGFFGRKTHVPGRLKFSNIRMAYYITDKNKEEETLLDIPLGLLAKTERSVEDKIFFCLEIFTKYGASFKVRYSDADLSSKSHKIITHLIDSSHHLPFEYGAKSAPELKCVLFCPVRAQQVKQAYWYDNQNWKTLPNYPQKFRVPMPYLSKTNPEERLVALSCVYNNGKDEVALWRTGPGRPDPIEDDWMAKAKAMNKIVTIQIKNKGIGSVRSLATRAFDLQNLQGLRDTFSSLVKLAANSHDAMKWMGQILNTKWYEQVGTLLQEASILVNQMISSPAHVTVLADTEVRGAQLVALAQVLLFPQCRTIKGFGDLLQRQFLQWGSPRSFLKKQTEPDRGPALIQFLDAVHQLTNIYPLSFEFRQSLLVFLAEQIYSNHFGNFLLLSKTIKEEDRESIQKCPCIWKTIESWLQSPQLASYYLNPFYVDYRQCDIYELKHTPSMKQVRIWGGFFFRKFRQSNIDYKIYHRYNELFMEQHKNKAEVQEMKKQLLNQHKVIQERRAVLQALKGG